VVLFLIALEYRVGLFVGEKELVFKAEAREELGKEGILGLIKSVICSKFRRN